MKNSQNTQTSVFNKLKTAEIKKTKAVKGGTIIVVDVAAL